MTRHTFIGIDLAWKPDQNPTGVAVLEECDGGAELAYVGSVNGAEGVREAIRPYLESAAVIAIDAPLIVKNIDKSRPCEIALSKEYGANHASCYPSNLTLFKGQPASAKLADWLSAKHGFVHAPDADSAPKVMMEVYPNAAFIALTDRKHTIKYKKGKVEDRCKGLAEVQCALSAIMSGAVRVLPTPRLEELLNRPPSCMRGAERKSFEDELDAVLCAYLAYRYAVIGREEFQVFGDGNSGYIVNPVRVTAASSCNPSGQPPCPELT